MLAYHHKSHCLSMFLFVISISTGQKMGQCPEFIFQLVSLPSLHFNVYPISGHLFPDMSCSGQPCSEMGSYLGVQRGHQHAGGAVANRMSCSVKSHKKWCRYRETMRNPRISISMLIFWGSKNLQALFISWMCLAELKRSEAWKYHHVMLILSELKTLS